MILNQPAFFARSATLDGAISDTDTQVTLSGLSTRFTDAVAAGTAGYENGTGLGPFRVSDDDGFELIAITDHVSGTTFEVERGIQGTDAAAWADGTAVRAVVTTRQLVEQGEDRGHVLSLIQDKDTGQYPSRPDDVLVCHFVGWSQPAEIQTYDVWTKIEEELPSFDIYVSSKNGDDLNDGTGPEQALRTLTAADAAITAFGNGAALGIESGSRFVSDDGVLDVGESDVVVGVYGDPGIAFVDLSIVLNPEDWVPTDGFDDVYEQTQPPVSDSVPDPRLFENDVPLGTQGSIADVEQFSGVSYTDRSGDPWVIYYKASDASDPRENGKTVSYTKQPIAYDSFANVVGKGGALRLFSARRPMSNSGAFRMGSEGVIERCIASDGGKHHFFHIGGITRDLIARGDTARSTLTATAGVYFHGSGIDVVQQQRLVRYMCRAKRTNPMFGHNTNGAGYDNAIAIGNIRWECGKPGDIFGEYMDYGLYTYKSGGIHVGQGPSLIEGAWIDDLDLEGAGISDKHEHGFTMRHSIVFDSNLTRNISNDNQTFTYENCIIITNRQTLRNSDATTGHSTVFNNCILVALGTFQTSFGLGSISGSNNIIFSEGRDNETHVGGVTRTLAQLETDENMSNNAWLTYDQLEAMLPPENWRRGDVRLPTTFYATHPDGTVASTFPDGTPLTTAGPQKHLDMGASDLTLTDVSLVWKPGPSPRFPTPPTTDQQDEEYILDPSGWDWFNPDLVIKNSEEKLLPLVTYYAMNAAADADETDLVQQNDLVPNGPVGSGFDGWSYRSIPLDSYLEATNVSGMTASPIWTAFPLRFEAIRTDDDRPRVWTFPFSSGGTRDGFQGLSYSLEVVNGLDSVSRIEEVEIGVWYIIQMWYDPATGRIGLRFDADEAQAGSLFDRTLSSDVASSITFGSRPGGQWSAEAIDVGPVMVARAAPTREDRDWLYNDGEYRSLAEMQNRTVRELFTPR